MVSGLGFGYIPMISGMVWKVGKLSSVISNKSCEIVSQHKRLTSILVSESRKDSRVTPHLYPAGKILSGALLEKQTLVLFVLGRRIQETLILGRKQ